MSPAPISTSTDVLINKPATKSTSSKTNGADFANVLAAATKPTLDRDRPVARNDKPVGKAIDPRDEQAKDPEVKDAPAKDTKVKDKDTDKPVDKTTDDKKSDDRKTDTDAKGEAVKDKAGNEAVVPVEDATSTPQVVPAPALPVVVPGAADSNLTNPAVVAPELVIANPQAIATAPQVAPAVATIQVAPAEAAAVTPTVDPTATNTNPVPATAVATDGSAQQVPTDDTNPLLATLAATVPVVAEAKAATAPVAPEAKQAGNEAAMAKAAIDSLAAASRTSETQQQTITPTSTKLTDTTMRSEPYQQVVKMVAPLRHLADGDYSVTMKLHPAHLGSVEITVALAGGQVNMSMNTDSSAARQILRDSMNDLRQSLTDSGLNAGSLDVGSQNTGRGNGQDNQQGANNSTWGTPADENDTFVRFNAAVPANVTAVNDGPLDVRL